jgi:hypothetical protein
VCARLYYQFRVERKAPAATQHGGTGLAAFCHDFSRLLND